MLIRHISIYALARGIPGLVSLLAIVAYSRLLTPEEYGQYSMLIAAAGFGSAIFFHWLSVGLLRFLPAHAHDCGGFSGTVLRAFIAVVLLTAIPGTIAITCYPDVEMRPLLYVGLVLCWSQSFHSLNLEFTRCQFKPAMYGALSTVRALIGLALGGLLAYWGFGALGLLAGALAGYLISSLWGVSSRWAGASQVQEDRRDMVKQLLAYGLPLTATYALGMLINTSDRFLIGYFLGAEKTGLYSAGYELAKNSIGMIMMIVNLAAYPLAVDALENRSRSDTERQLENNLIALLAVSLPSVVGMVLLSENITAVFLGRLFSGAARELMPLIAVGALCSGLKSYYFDLSFQLGRSTLGQVWVVLVAAMVNIVINVLTIPVWGLVAAAYANIVAYATGLLLSWLVGMRIFRLPFPLRKLAKIFVATACMALFLYPVVSWRGAIALAFQVIWGVLVFVVCAYGLDVAGFRKKIVLISRGGQVGPATQGKGEYHTKD